jgi:hypothetical protein
MPTPNTTAPYEMYAQREMNALATKIGTLRAELQIVRCTLSALQPSIDDWQKDELRILIARIDDVLEEKP